jgi:CRP/FNR family transcriptional regulator
MVKNGTVTVGMSLTHEELSQLMGTSRESITRTLADFRKKNLMELKGSTLTIHDKPALERLVTV